MDGSSSFVDTNGSNDSTNDDHGETTYTPPVPSVQHPTSAAPAPSSDRVLPRMREQDADLLESMHYAASQVSQYSPDGTPLLRPQDRSLPMEDVPLLQLLPLSSTSDLLMQREEKNPSGESASNDATTVVTMGRTLSSPLNRDNSSGSRDDVGNNSTLLFHRLSLLDSHLQMQHSSTSSTTQKTVRFPDDPESRPSIPDTARLDMAPTNLERIMEGSGDFESHPPEPLTPSTSATFPRCKLRRLLSGEVRTIPGNDSGDDGTSSNHDSADGRQLFDGETPCAPSEAAADGEKRTPEGEEQTKASPGTAAQEAAKAKTEQDDGLAERRRRNEAIQFAQAVGEEIAMNRNDLRIIEDHEDGDDFDNDESDDEAIESKKIMIPNNVSGSQYDIHHEDLMISTTVTHDSVSSVPLLSETLQETPQKINPPDLSRTGSLAGDLANHADILTPLPRVARHLRRKSRPMWPFEQPADMEMSFMEHLSDGMRDSTDFVYKGIQANPPEITKRGIQRGNYAQLHRKAWLEVSDKYHRYGKNLRLYYRYWERLGFPTNSFFDWLDSKGEAAGAPLPNMDECPRSVLDSDTVLYITNPSITDRYALDIIVGDDGRGRIIDVDGDPVVTGAEGWIFVLRDNVMYGAAKITSITGHSKQRFHHSSFFCGKAVASAGIVIADDDGYLTRLYPHSGHYRPGEAHTQRMLLFLHRKGVDLRTFELDTQQLSHVSREKETKGKDENAVKKKKTNDDGSEKEKGKEEKKVKKVDSLHLERAVDVACFLAHKADFIGKGIFDKIHQIRKADVTSVTEALNLVDDGGYWKRRRATILE